jgi:hypothetical protein
VELEKSDRPWGRYEVLQEAENHKVKCIWVSPGKRLSYQRHQKRAEHWFIVQGTALVTIDGVDRVRQLISLLAFFTELLIQEAMMSSLLRYKLAHTLEKMISSA